MQMPFTLVISVDFDGSMTVLVNPKATPMSDVAALCQKVLDAAHAQEAIAHPTEDAPQEPKDSLPQ